MNKTAIFMDTLIIAATYLLLRFVEVFYKVICCLSHVFLYFNRKNSWWDKKKSQAVLKNSKNDDKSKANALRLNRKVIEGAGCVSAWRLRYKQVGQLLCGRMLC